MDGVPVSQPLPVVVTCPDDRLTALFDAHYERLYRLARRLAGSRDDALDLVQETYLRAAAAGASIPVGETAEEAWLVRVLVNLQRDAWRKGRVRAQHRVQSPQTDAGPSPESALVASAAVWRAMATLAPRRRAIVVMHELEELPVRAIAQSLGVSPVTVRWHLCRARHELARVLNAPRRTP